MQLVFKAGNITEAQIVKGLLESNGIEAYAGGYYLQGGVGGIASMDFANVQVAEEDVSKARAIIDEYEHGDLQTNGATTPSTSSIPAKLNAKTSEGRKLFLVIIISVVIGALFYLMSA